MPVESYLAIGQRLLVSVLVLIETDTGDVEEIEKTFESDVKDLDFENKRLLISPPGVREEDIRRTLHPGAEVTLQISHPLKGQIYLNLTVQSIQTQGLMGYWLSLEDLLEHLQGKTPDLKRPPYQVIQRRQHVRVPILDTLQKLVKVTPCDENGDPDLEQPFTRAQVYNISGGGLRLGTHQGYPAGSMLALTLQLPETDIPLSLKARVVYTRPLADLFEGHFGRDTRPAFVIGLSFREITAGQEQKIMQFCFAQEIGLKP